MRTLACFHHSCRRSAPPTIALVAFVIGAGSVGCAHTGEYVWVDDLGPQALAPPVYRIQPGDQLAIAVWNQATLSGATRVRPDGLATLPLVGEVPLAGETIASATEQVRALLDELVIDPKVTITLLETRPPAVSVVGEVKTAGSYPLLSRDNILDILAKAGGLTEFAGANQIYLIRADPKPLRVRFDYDRLTEALGKGIRFPLRDGDVIVVR